MGLAGRGRVRLAGVDRVPRRGATRRRPTPHLEVLAIVTVRADVAIEAVLLTVALCRGHRPFPSRSALRPRARRMSIAGAVQRCASRVMRRGSHSVSCWHRAPPLTPRASRSPHAHPRCASPGAPRRASEAQRCCRTLSARQAVRSACTPAAAAAHTCVHARHDVPAEARLHTERHSHIAPDSLEARRCPRRSADERHTPRVDHEARNTRASGTASGPRPMRDTRS